MNSDFKPSNTTHKVLDPNAISQKSVAYYAPIRLQQIYHQTFHTIFTSRQCAMSAFNASQVDLNTASKEDVLCFLALSENEYNGHLGARISSIFVILFVSSAFTFFPVVAKSLPSWKIPYGVYLFARYFGTGVIVATAFIHLLDPAYKRIGPKTCVGESGYWGEYSWCAAIVLGSVMIIFLMDLAAEVYVERKCHAVHSSYDQEKSIPPVQTATTWTSDNETAAAERSFKQQIAAFLILEFGIIFHSVIIGLNLGVTGSEFATLYPVLVFHQSFEGLGIGARMSAIPFDKHTWLPWILCAMYGLTTPISIAIGLGVRTTYNPGSKVALIVQGVLNAISAGVLIYSGLVELLARDFLFDPDRTKRRSQLLFMVFCTLLGAGIMALIGKWA
ncbi:zinc-regulated transporter 1 [Aspergillus nomiae NRRL 13137]|uniref:Zinc-regulated transporter 1 n=1 Tax=Aspergillus nomiae NRRL (strain ATCC 15546 / NRRL 13137 / CBS 260.88 / M93) TaxID=1509407 RepID=A0A0L1J9P7_ASPN3|nr:zinc-regulated transporter 1 [Aspergillus nomiae NRRL 13137]KNG88511.1 zinc-regulated transporter 1 [Aspergillus nomiae NRRL 13137]